MIVILNARSGPASGIDAVQARVEEEFRKQKVEAEIRVVSAGSALPRLAEEAANSSARVIVAGGGDGTLNAVANALVGTDKIFGVLPLGTLNHFAKDLGLPLELPGAIRTLAKGEERLVDVGEVNGRIFLNNSSLGLYPRIVRHRAEQQERLGRGKWPAFAWALLSALRLSPRLRLQVTVGGETSLVRTPFFFVGNNRYRMELLRLGGRDRLDGGELGLYYARYDGAFGLVGLVMRSLFGRLRQAENFTVEAVQSVELQSRRKSLDVSADGEVRRIEMPLRYRIRPRALRVLAPKMES